MVWEFLRGAVLAEDLPRICLAIYADADNLPAQMLCSLLRILLV